MTPNAKVVKEVFTSGVAMKFHQHKAFRTNPISIAIH